MKGLHVKAAALALLLLFQGGCVTASPDGAKAPDAETEAKGQEEPDAGFPKQYAIRLDGRATLVFDQDGNEIPPERQFDVLYDVNGHPQCQKRTLVEDSGEDDEYGNPVLRRTTALYDLDGNLLRDFEEIDYEGGFGDFLIRHTPTGFMVDVSQIPQGYHTGLWNYRTGQEVLDKVKYVHAMGGEKEEYLLTDVNAYLLGIVDNKGNVLRGFPPPEGIYHATPWKGMILAQNKSFDSDWEGGKTLLLRDDLTELAAAETISSDFATFYGDYLYAMEGEQEKVLDSQGKECYTPPEGERVDYFDGELAILSNMHKINSAEGGYLRLVSIDGTDLAAGFDALQALKEQDGQAAIEKFAGLRGDTVEVIDRTGKVLASRQVPGVTDLYTIGHGLITYSTQQGVEGLLNEKLEVLVEPGIYQWIRCYTSWNNNTAQEYHLLEASYYVIGDYQKNPDKVNVMRRDLLDLSGNKVVGGLTSIDGAGPNRIAVVRGFSAGLMDWEGNWIVKKSIFQNLNDDYNQWGAY